MWLPWHSVSIEPGLSWDPPSPDPDLEFVYMSYPMSSLSRPSPDVQQPQGGQSPEGLCGPSHHLKAGAIPKAMGQTDGCLGGDLDHWVPPGGSMVGQGADPGRAPLGLLAHGLLAGHRGSPELMGRLRKEICTSWGCRAQPPGYNF